MIEGKEEVKGRGGGKIREALSERGGVKILLGGGSLGSGANLVAKKKTGADGEGQVESSHWALGEGTEEVVSRPDDALVGRASQS